MNSFEDKFKTLDYVIKKADSVLLFAHSSPDGDTSGAVLALKSYLNSIGKEVVIACNDPLPDFLQKLTFEKFIHPSHIDFSKFDAAIGCDSVERGFDSIMPKLSERTVTIIFDHHPDIALEGDITMIDASYSSTCQLIYDYFEHAGVNISKNISTFLLVGILSDTGNFQHSNTTPRVIQIASILLSHGASLSKIIKTAIEDKKLSTLKLWGRAFDKAKINPRNGMISTALTKKDIDECNASTEDISAVASILNTVPGTKFALVLSERSGQKIKGSLRSEAYKGVDVSEIAHLFGGGGHKLASGFEITGTIVETSEGWEIV